MRKIKPITFYLFIICFSLLVNSCTEEKESTPEILLVGTFHKIEDSLNCNWQYAYQKIFQYKPDHIAVEYNKPSDSLSHNFTLGINWKMKLDSLKLAWDHTNSSPEDSILKYSSLSHKNSDINNHIQLWKYFFLNADLGNRDYQSYLIYTKFDDIIASIDTTQNFDSLFYHRHNAIVKNRKFSEFFNLVFPLADQFNIAYLEPTDNKSTYAMQSNAYSDLLEEITDSLAWERYYSFWEDFNSDYSNKLPECNGLSYVNTKAFLKTSDYGQAHIFDDLNSTSFQEYSHIWYKRNELIGDNIINVINRKKAKKIAVFYGFMHVYPVQKYLEEKGYKVKILEDLTDDLEH